MGKDVADVGIIASSCGPWSTPTRSLRAFTELGGTWSWSPMLTDSDWTTIASTAMGTYASFDAAMTGIAPSWWAGVAVNDRHALQTNVIAQLRAGYP